MTKTYIPQAVDEVNRMNRYFARWASKMTIGASPSQIAALSALIACIATFLVEWHKPPPVN